MSESVEFLTMSLFKKWGDNMLRKNRKQGTSKIGIMKKLLTVVVSMFIISGLLIGGIMYTMITDIFINEKLSSDLNHGYSLIDKEYPGDWNVKDGKLYKGQIALNDNFGVVDEIKKNTGTFVTLFLEDTRVSTNVLKEDGSRAIGTKASPEVIETVLNKGQEFTGEAKVVNMDCLTKYVPLKDAGGKVIGMFFVGVDQKYISNIVNPFIVRIGIIMAVIIAVSVALITIIVLGIVKNLKKVMLALDGVSHGDLTMQEVNVRSKDEINSLAQSTNTMLRDLRSMLHKINEASMQVSASAEQMSASAEQNTQAVEQIAASSVQAADGSRRQLESINQASGIVNDISTGLKNVALNSKDMYRQSEYTVNVTGDGLEILQTLTAQMKDINNAVQEIAETINNLELRSNEIGSIVQLITDISEQTNLLALNASIEAARAGEHGRGFSVVAQEIRNLAEQTKESASRISTTVHDIQLDTERAAESMDKGTAKVSQGMAAANKVNEAFSLIRTAMDQVMDKVKSVAADVEHMGKGSDETVKEMDLIKTIADESVTSSQQNAAMSQEQLGATEEMAASSQSLANLAEELNEIISVFKL